MLMVAAFIISLFLIVFRLFYPSVAFTGLTIVLFLSDAIFRRKFKKTGESKIMFGGLMEVLIEKAREKNSGSLITSRERKLNSSVTCSIYSTTR